MTFKPKDVTFVTSPYSLEEKIRLAKQVLDHPMLQGVRRKNVEASSEMLQILVRHAKLIKFIPSDPKFRIENMAYHYTACGQHIYRIPEKQITWLLLQDPDFFERNSRVKLLKYKAQNDI